MSDLSNDPMELSQVPTQDVDQPLHKRRALNAWPAFGLVVAGCLGLITQVAAAPKVILISLDGAIPQQLERYLEDGTLSDRGGLGILIKRGPTARRNITITPSLTAPSHIAIATGASAANNDINANSFHLVASPFSRNISGF